MTRSDYNIRIGGGGDHVVSGSVHWSIWYGKDHGNPGLNASHSNREHHRNQGYLLHHL